MAQVTIHKSVRFIRAVRRPPVQSGQDTSLQSIRSKALGLALEKDPALVAMNSAVETLGAEVKDVSGKLADARTALGALDALAQLNSVVAEAETKRSRVINAKHNLEVAERNQRSQALELTGFPRSTACNLKKIRDFVWAQNVDTIIQTYDVHRISEALKIVRDWLSDLSLCRENSTKISAYFTRDNLLLLQAKLNQALTILQTQEHAEIVYKLNLATKLKANEEYQRLEAEVHTFTELQSGLSAQKEEATRRVTHLLSSLEAEEDERQERFDAHESERFNRTLKKSLIGGAVFGVVGAFTLLATPLFPVPAIFFAGAAAVPIISSVLSRKKKYKRAKLDEKNLKKHLNAEIPRLQDQLLELTQALKESAEVVQTLVGQQERRFSSLKGATANEASTPVQATADKKL